MWPSTISPERVLRAWRCAAALAVALLLAGPAQAARPAEGGWTGRVVRVSDGDTLWVQPAGGGKPRKIRLRGMDAPESCQPHGQVAKAALAARVLHQPVRVSGRARDDYQRLLARVSTAHDPDIGAWMVAQGHAWSYRQRGSSGPYAQQELAARSAGRGLWAQHGAVEPRAFRRRHGPCR